LSAERCFFLSLGSIGPVYAEERTDDVTLLQEECNSDACKAQLDQTGRALLQVTNRIDYSSIAAPGIEEITELSHKLSGSQMQTVIKMMKSMNNEIETTKAHISLASEGVTVSDRASRQPAAQPAGHAPLPVLNIPTAKPTLAPGEVEDTPLVAPVPKGKLEPTIPEVHEQEHRTLLLAKFIVVPISFVFFILYNVSTWMEKNNITAIPESLIVILIGVVLGFFMKKYAQLDFFDDEEAWAELNSAMLNLLFLPIIIFASGWTLRRQDFFSQFPYILIFACGGTAISTCVVASLINLTGSLHHVVRWRTAFAYAALISATDPVATLSTYSKLKVQPLLNIMVFGESTINDAVAIVLFKVFNSDTNFIDPETGTELLVGTRLISNILWGVCKSFFGSLLFGVLLGMGYTLIAKAADMKHDKKAQILIIFVSCYLTYALAESVGLSGIIAEIFCSLVMGVYMRPHLSEDGCEKATFFMEQVATLADSAVFLLVGVSVVNLTTKGWYLGLYVIVFCLIGRFCATFPLAILVNSLKTARGVIAGGDLDSAKNILSSQHIFMMWHGGLRGGIALALAWELGKWVDVDEGLGTRKALQTATFLVILVFLAVFGGSTSYCLDKCQIPMGKDEPEDVLSQHETPGLGCTWLTTLDNKVFQPILVGEKGNSAETSSH